MNQTKTARIIIIKNNNKNRINTSAHKALGFRLAIQGDSDFIIQSINHNGFSNFSM